MYLFSAIKDALFARRPSFDGTDADMGERPKRRSVSEAFLPADSPEPSDRDVPVGHKAKRMDSDVPIRDYETKRRRTTFGIESKPRLSIDREDVGRFTSGSRLPSPLPRHSMPGPGGSRRDSILGSPSVAPLSRGSSPRASPLTPSHPRFVDLLRRDPSQQRALDSARSILDTLDRVTSVSGGIGAPGSGRKYRPPQPLRPMRFKSLTSATRPVSLYDMLSGATTPAAVPASPQAPAIRAPTGKSQEPSPLAKPMPVMTTTTMAAFPGSPRPFVPAESPKKTFLVPTKLPSPVHKPVEEPQTNVSSIFEKKPELPIKETLPLVAPVAPAPPAAAPEPPKGGFIWGDPSKVSDADFIDDDGFAPGADDDSSSSSEDEKPVESKPVSIFGNSSSTSIFGTATISSEGTKTEPKSIFGSAVAGSIPSPKSKPQPSIFGAPSSPKSIFGTGVPASPKSASQPAFGTSAPTGSIFGSTTTEPPAKTEVSSIFGGPATTSTTSIFGAPAPSSSTAPSGSSTGSIFGSSTTPGTSLFGSSTTETTTTTTTTAPSGTSLFGAAGPAETSVSSIFGGASTATTEKPVSSIFGSATKPTEQPAAAPPSSTGMFVFGATPPASPGAASAPAPTGSSSIFGSSAAVKPAEPATTSTSSIFGQTPAPASTGSSLFGGVSAPVPSQSSIFGSSNAQQPSSIFGGGTAAAPASGSSIFGSTAPASSSLFGSASSAAPSGTSIFGSSGSTLPPASPFGAAPPASNTSIFGASSTPSATDLFGSSAAASAQAPANTSIFGSTAPTPTENVFGSTGIAPASPFGVPAGGIFGAPSPAPTPGGDNPFAASSEDFNKAGAPKRKILKAARRG